MIEIIPNWHPVFVHFPIAFATAAVFFAAIGKLFKIKPWATQCLIFGRWMLWAAAIFACISAVFGWFAYNSIEHDDAGHLAMTLHRNWALGTLGVLLLLVIIDMWPKRTTAQPSYGFLLLMFAVWLLVIGTAWHGGEVVYRHGLGVMALPEAEGPGHPHEHGAGHDHGDIPVPIEGSPQEEHVHGDATHGAHPHVTEPGINTPAAEAANPAPKKTVHTHTHAPGTPPHKD